MYSGQIPFSPKTGQPMYYAQNGYAWIYRGQRYESWMTIERKFGNAAVKEAERVDVPPDWRDNKQFRAVMEIKSMSRGRSAANFDLVDEDGMEYTIFMTDLLALLQEYGVTQGKTDRLEWEFCKRGQNYGVRASRV